MKRQRRPTRSAIPDERDWSLFAGRRHAIRRVEHVRVRLACFDISNGDASNLGGVGERTAVDDDLMIGNDGRSLRIELTAGDARAGQMSTATPTTATPCAGSS